MDTRGRCGNPVGLGRNHQDPAVQLPSTLETHSGGQVSAAVCGLELSETGDELRG